MTAQEIIIKATEVHELSYDYSLLDPAREYRTHDRIPIICPRHNVTFTPELRLFLAGSNCNLCANELRILHNRKTTMDDFRVKADKVHHGRYDYLGEYVNAHTPILIRCLSCGRVFPQTPNDHLCGKGCSFCRISHLEMDVENELIRRQIEYVQYQRFSWLLRQNLDFYLPSYHLGIECQGRQHFEPVKAFGGESEFQRILDRDRRKRELCEANGVRLLYYAPKRYSSEEYEIFHDLSELFSSFLLEN